MNKSEDSIFSSAYLPPFDYFKVLHNSGRCLIEQWENYQKQSFRNRCNIYGANGLLSLIIPVDRSKGLSLPIKEITIDYGTNWQKGHWKAIESAYNSSPFFEYYSSDFFSFYNKEHLFLFDFNTELTRLLISLLGIETELSFTECYIKEYSKNDYRSAIHPKKKSPFENSNKKGQYHQVFAQKYGFIENLSVIDLLFNEGPESLRYLKAD